MHSHRTISKQRHKNQNFWKVFPSTEKEALEEPSTEECFISKIFSIYLPCLLLRHFFLHFFFAHFFLLFRTRWCQCVTKIDFSVDREKIWRTHTYIYLYMSPCAFYSLKNKESFYWPSIKIVVYFIYRSITCFSYILMISLEQNSQLLNKSAILFWRLH